jgi:hypothetical protein
MFAERNNYLSKVSMAVTGLRIDLLFAVGS